MLKVESAAEKMVQIDHTSTLNYYIGIVSSPILWFYLLSITDDSLRRGREMNYLGLLCVRNEVQFSSPCPVLESDYQIPSSHIISKYQSQTKNCFNSSLPVGQIKLCT